MRQIDCMAEISVLIPSFKPGEYIFRCLDSIERQRVSRDSFCVYIALNGPRGNYYEIWQDALRDRDFDHRFIYIEESGVSNARNALLDISDEPYVTFIDDDDCVSECYLSGFLNAANPGLLVVSNVMCFEEDVGAATPNYIGRFFMSSKGRLDSAFRARKFYSSSCAKLIPRDVIGNTRFDTKLRRGEDSLFMAQLSANVQGVRKAAASTYYVYSRPGSASRASPKVWSELVHICYLVSKYGALFFDPRYEKMFIVSRLVATLNRVRRLFRFYR